VTATLNSESHWRLPRYRVKVRHESKGDVLQVGDVVECLREHIDHMRGTHKLQVRRSGPFGSVVMWLPRKKLSVLR